MDFVHFLSSHMLDPKLGGKRLYAETLAQAVHAEACGYRGVAIPEHHLANMITRAGAHRVLTMDLHAGQIQGFFDIPTDNLVATPVLAQDIKDHYPRGDELPKHKKRVRDPRLPPEHRCHW